jgi:hypothetical protein
MCLEDVWGIGGRDPCVPKLGMKCGKVVVAVAVAVPVGQRGAICKL